MTAAYGAGPRDLGSGGGRFCSGRCSNRRSRRRAVDLVGVGPQEDCSGLDRAWVAVLCFMGRGRRSTRNHCTALRGISQRAGVVGSTSIRARRSENDRRNDVAYLYAQRPLLRARSCVICVRNAMLN